jgi:hypothetical protein
MSNVLPSNQQTPVCECGDTFIQIEAGATAMGQCWQYVFSGRIDYDQFVRPFRAPEFMMIP